MLKLFNTQNIHIEVSSKCTLKCPRCPRTETKHDDLNKEISLEEFKIAFPPELLAAAKNLSFCGDIGDPIYATDFIEIIQYIKEHSTARLLIITNGSYKKPEWWKQLGLSLASTDVVHFSIDGWDNDSNNIYRVNSDFDSITKGIAALREASTCLIRWSTIYFNFNEDKMDAIIELARTLGCDEWEGVNSTKFDGVYLIDGVDLLKPADQNNIGSKNIYNRNRITLNRVIPSLENQIVNNHEWAKCLNHKKEMFVSVEGLVFPCPWFNSGYQSNPFVQKNKDKLNIKTRSLSEVLADPLWSEFVQSLNTCPLEICEIKCHVNR